MTSIIKLKAAKKFGPGYFIKEQMGIRGWVQEEMAEVLGMSPKHLNSILQDKQALSIENARKLASAFDTSPQYWLNLDNDYRLWSEQKNKNATTIVQTKALIYSRMPVRDMIKKGWIGGFNNTNDLVEQVKRFWSTSALDFTSLDEAILPLCKKSEVYNQFNASYALTWFQMAKTFSKCFDVPSYDFQALQQLCEKISSYTTATNGIGLFLNHLNRCGVKFFILPHLEKTYLDGAAFLMGNSPVLVYTARYRRIDNFWFTVAHEIAHILRHLNENNHFILDNLGEENSDKLEVEANMLAAKYLKHIEILEYLEPYLNYLNTGRINECAEKLNIHPSIIIGALAFNKTISFRNINLFNQNVLTSIPEVFKHKSVYQESSVL